MRLAILFVILFNECAFSLRAQDHVPDTLFWKSDYKLNKEDFKGLPDTSNPYYKDKTAASAVEIAASGYWEKDLPNFKVDVMFIKSQSWYRDSIFYDNVLGHEQLHFDITELFARKIKAKFAQLRDSNCSDIDVYTSMIEGLLDERSAYDEMYDKQTNHGVNYQEQKAWVERVRNELMELQQYSSDKEL